MFKILLLIELFLDQIPLDEEGLNHLEIFHSITLSLSIDTYIEWLHNFLEREGWGSLEENSQVCLALNP